MNIVLIGLMGSGKSAVGRLLAEKLGRPFVDTDELVVEQTGRAIADLFATEGEAAFREREAAIIAQVSARDGQVIATGGGAVLRAENREALCRTGLVIWLDAPPEALYHRARAQGLERRPLLAGPNPLGRLRALAESRAEAYQAAMHVRLQTDGKVPLNIVDEIMALLASNEGVTDHG